MVEKLLSYAQFEREFFEVWDQCDRPTTVLITALVDKLAQHPHCISLDAYFYPLAKYISDRIEARDVPLEWMTQWDWQKIEPVTLNCPNREIRELQAQVPHLVEELLGPDSEEDFDWGGFNGFDDKQ